MKTLIICMLLHELRVAEPSTWHRWQLPRDRLQSESSMEAAEATELLSRSWNDENGLLDQPIAEQRKRIAEPEEYTPTRIRLSIRSFCSCESQYEIKDLGEGHYPRYLTVSRCKPKTCQSKFQSCKLLYYMVHVLRLRETNTPSKDWYTDDNTLPESPLPESLHHKWQLKPISVAVACVPTSDSRRN